LAELTPRAYAQYQLYGTDILKNAFLQSMYDQNQVKWIMKSLIVGAILPVVTRPLEGWSALHGRTR
jgi:hypothetical protein